MQIQYDYRVATGETSQCLLEGIFLIFNAQVDLGHLHHATSKELKSGDQKL